MTRYEMTKEEAIARIKYHKIAHKMNEPRAIYISEAIDMAIEALEKDTCEDAISRDAVLEKAVYTETEEGWCGYTVDVDYIKSLPPVNPQPKTGHWEWVPYDYNPKLGDWHCSECRCVVVECVEKNEKGGIPLYKYCPQCGKKMRAESEGEKNDET